MVKAGNQLFQKFSSDHHLHAIACAHVKGMGRRGPLGSESKNRFADSNSDDQSIIIFLYFSSPLLPQGDPKGPILVLSSHLCISVEHLTWHLQSYGFSPQHHQEG